MQSFEKLQKVINGGDFYGAQQMYKSTRARKIYEAFLRNAVPDHVGDDDDMQKLSEVLGTVKIRVEACASILRAAIRWSIELGPDKNGSWDLHTMLAEYIYSETPEVAS
ncbi:uncharacterized protein LOC110705991 [Chenopodium quinoa]|uniref:uncharacterized protein LOC110705991 n=1 Tax=Chenopodium quinoa TaxID=63459 RepID=UPI000B789B63|nr:uncharacterized protein LOC110705991 [Chenopodium quinoa]